MPFRATKSNVSQQQQLRRYNRNRKLYSAMGFTLQGGASEAVVARQLLC